MSPGLVGLGSSRCVPFGAPRSRKYGAVACHHCSTACDTVDDAEPGASRTRSAGKSERGWGADHPGRGGASSRLLNPARSRCTWGDNQFRLSEEGEAAKTTGKSRYPTPPASHHRTHSAIQTRMSTMPAATTIFFRFGHLPTSITWAWTYETNWPFLGMLPAGFEPASEARKAPILDRTRLRERNGRLAA